MEVFLLGFSFLARFIARYFILFEVIMNGIVFLTSFSASLLLVYRRTIDWPDIVAHVCNPSYTEGRDWEDCNSRPVQVKKNLARPYSINKPGVMKYAYSLSCSGCYK
jgi:hypothetical protein